MARSVTTLPGANHKPARLPTFLLDALLENMGQDALSAADLKARLPGRSLRALRRSRPRPVRKPVLSRVLAERLNGTEG
jgi:hypothetical protein